jgi:hypothetical protein
VIIIADGSLKFDTKVDDSGFVEGIQKMSSKQIKLQNIIKKTQAEMSKLEKSMEDMKNAKVPTQEYQDIQKQIADAKSKLDSFLETERRMKDTGAKQSGQSWKSLQWKIEDARNTLKAANLDMKELEASGSAFTIGGDTSKLDSMQAKYNSLSGKLTEYSVRLSELQQKEAGEVTSSTRVSRALGLIASAAGKAWTGIKNLGAATVSISGKLGRLALTAGKAAGSFLKMINPLKGIRSATDGGSNSISKFTSRIMRMAKTAFVFAILRNGFNSLRRYITNMLKTNAQFAASIAQVKGNLMTAFQPVYEACLPAINALASALATATGYLAQFTSMLLGKSVKSSQAAAKSQYEQVKALEDTAKAAKKAKKEQKSLAGIDDVQILANNKDSDSGSGSGSNVIKPDFTSAIEESSNVSDFVDKLKKAWQESDFTEIGQIIAGKINDAISNIDWSSIQGTSQKIATSIYTFINGFVCELDWSGVGKTVGNGLNTVVDFANTFVKGLDWGKLGTGIGTGIDALIKTVNWVKLGETFSTYYSGVFKAIDSTITAINWDNVGNSLGSGLQAAINKMDWQGAGQLVSNGLNSVATLINSFYKSVDWIGFGSNMASSLNTAIAGTNWSNVGTAIGNALNTAIDTAYGFITEFDWSSFGQGIADGINGILTTTNWVELAEGASSLVIGLLDSIATAIREIDWLNIGNTIGEMLSNINWLGIAGGIIDLLVSAFNGLVSTIFGIGKTIGTNIMDGLKNGIKISDILKNAGKWIKEHIFDPIVNNIKKLFGIHSPSTVMLEIGGFIMKGMINGITSLVGTVVDKFKNLVSDIKSFFVSIPDWFGDKFNAALTKIKSVFSAAAVKNHFSSIWEDIKSCFSSVANWFKDIFTKAWTNVKNVFSTGGKIFDGIKDGIADTFKSVVNKLISGINTIIAVPFNAINGMLNRIHDISILGLQPFSGLWSRNPLSVPQIPKLATGTVVPKNYGEFLAILGDNKRETEVVSPLNTIKQALKEAMRETGGSGTGTINLKVYLDSKVVYDAVVKQNNSNTRRTGRNALAEGLA